MELRVLKYFLAVAREENITAAALSLHVTQPTLSKQLKELEDELGTQLFIRGNRRITLTEDGIFLRKRAQEILDLTEKTETELKESDEIISGDIYIGGGETEAIRILAKVVKQITEEYPLIHFHLYSGNANDVTERLDRGLLDFGILIEPVDLKKYDFQKLPATDTWGLLMRKDSPFATKDTIKPEDLLELPLLCSNQTLVKNELSGWAGIDFDKMNIIATYNLIFNASIMVQEGVGYALCLDKLVNTTGVSDLIFKPLEPSLVVGLDIVWKKYQVFSKASKMFLARLQGSISN
ncbi:LysR family transcriptional regulator [[Clostridium] fimetarium]|uniref:DNA-binding transcriptional regulator, LysR family n=1 Tax=[Clostridium] fimetarium TaxID=99656 RepID=A0A1I0Q5Z2_9FIRM|nr:LysR family transcriptional regulator [[Clostridium] fimetarium]SEW22195.1 DNA-binding transcriptional regulator, LysR family [[Clostridium] fimetarium]